jgi:hypothetical protein
MTVLQGVFDLKEKIDVPKWGSVMSEEAPQYSVCNFVVNTGNNQCTGALSCRRNDTSATRILGNLWVPIDEQFFYNSLMTVASSGINYMSKETLSVIV